MRCLTESECESEAQHLGLTLGEGFLSLMDGREPSSVSLRIPLHTGEQAALVNSLFRPDSGTKQWLLWLTAWGIFPSEEYPVIWREIREKHGESRPLIEAPGHLFGEGEGELVRGMARLAMLFAWDAFFWPAPPTIAGFMSHDEVLFLYAKDEDALAAATADLGSFLVK